MTFLAALEALESELEALPLRNQHICLPLRNQTLVLMRNPINLQ